MQRARINALIQNINQGLLACRQSEIVTYSGFYSSFGAQAALIGGFAYASLTQISYKFVLIDNFVYDVFWISSAMCTAAAMHVILTTIFLQVLGPGMALHGPVGSMAKSAVMMADEMKQIFSCFIAMMIFFALSTLSSFWCLMSIHGASASTVLFLIGASQWWRFCSRIYNKFYYAKQSDACRTGDELGDLELGIAGIGEQDAIEAKPGKAETIWSVFKPFSLKSLSNSSTKSSPNNNNNDNNCNSCEDASTKKSGKQQQFAMEGYLSKRSAGRENSWDRRYFVLSPDGELYYYRSKAAYVASPEKPVKARPIELDLYSVRSVSRPNEAWFQIILELKDNDEEDGGGVGLRQWQFRCDTSEELELWCQNLTLASNSCD